MGVHNIVLVPTSMEKDVACAKKEIALLDLWTEEGGIPHSKIREKTRTRHQIALR